MAVQHTPGGRRAVLSEEVRGAGALFIYLKVRFFSFGMPLPGTSTRAKGVCGGGCVKYTPVWRVRASASAWRRILPSRPVINTQTKAMMACWAMTDGRTNTAAGDQSRGWCAAPPMVEEADSGSWSPDPAAPAPCFRATSRQAGADDDTATESDDEATDLTSGVFSDPTGPISDPPTRRTAAIQTAKGPIDYNVDWGGVEGAAGPCLAAVQLLHIARKSVGTSRWWTMHAVTPECGQSCRPSGRAEPGRQDLQADASAPRARPQLPRPAVDADERPAA